MADCIQLQGIRCYGYVGYFSEEQTLGQWFEVNLWLWLDLAQAGSSDRLEDTLDYGQIIQATQKLVETAKFSLLEKLATAIATQIFDLQTHSHPIIEQVKVQLVKLSPAIPNFSGRVVIEITRPNPNLN